MFTGGKLFVNNNVVKDPMKDFNACDDFFMTVLTSHIICCCHEVHADRITS